MNKSPRYHIIIHIFTLPILGELVPSYGRKMATRSVHFLLLFGSTDGAVELARSRNKVHAKNEKSAFCEVFVARYIPILQYIQMAIIIIMIIIIIIMILIITMIMIIKKITLTEAAISMITYCLISTDI